MAENEKKQEKRAVKEGTFLMMFNANINNAIRDEIRQSGTGWNSLDEAVDNNGFVMYDEAGNPTVIKALPDTINAPMDALYVDAALNNRLFIKKKDSDDLVRVQVGEFNKDGLEAGAISFADVPKQEAVAEGLKPVLLDKPARPSLWVRFVHAVFGGYKAEMEAYREALSAYERQQQELREAAQPAPKQEEAPKKEEEPVKQVEVKKQPRTLEPYKEANVNGFFSRMNFAVKNTAKIPEGNVKLTQEEYGVLAAMALASPDLSINVRGQDDQKVKQNNDPDKNYTRIVEDVYFDNKPLNAGSRMNGFIKAGGKAVSDAVTMANEGNTAALGKLITDGLKRNLKMIETQKPLNDKFTCGVELNDKVLAVAEKFGIGEMVRKGLGDDMVKINAYSNINKLRKDALKSQEDLVNLYNGDKIMSKAEMEKGKIDTSSVYGSEKDIVNVSHFSAVEKQYIAGTLDLNSYANEKTVENINGMILKHNTVIQNFRVSKIEENRAAIVQDPDKMAKLYTNAIAHAQRENEKELSAQHEKKLDGGEMEKKQDGIVIKS